MGLIGYRIKTRPKIPRNKYGYLTDTSTGGGSSTAGTVVGGTSSGSTITYSEFTGATASTDGISGLVPAPSAGQQLTYLCGNGYWQPFVNPDWYSFLAINNNGDGIKLTGKFEVTSDTRLNNLDVDGNSNLNNGVSVTYDGDTVFNVYNDIYAYSDTYVNADLTVKNDLTVQKDLTVTGYTYLGNFSAGSALVSYIHDTGKLYVDGATYTHYIKNTGNIENTGDIYNRSGDIITKNLTVTGQAHFFELVIDKIKSVGGAAMFTPADGFTVYSYNYNSDDNTYTLYWDNKNGNGANMWEVGDQALCMNFKQAKVGTSYSTANKYWWSLVTDKGLSGSGNYAYITISNTTYAGNINIAEGDDVVMCGHRQQLSESADVARQRGSAIYIAAANSLDTELTAPLYAQYRGIDNFDLASHRYSYFDARNAEFIGSFKVSSEKSIEDYIDEQIGEKSDSSISLVVGTNNVNFATDKDGYTSSSGSVTFEIALYKGNTKLTNGEYSLEGGQGWTGFNYDTEDIYPNFTIGWDEDQKLTAQSAILTVTAYDSDGVKYTRSTTIQVTPVKQGNTGSGTGTKGDDGYTVNANPESLIYNANDKGIVSPTVARTPIITLSVLKGNDDITEWCEFGTPITYNCTVSFDSDNNPGIYQIWTIGTQTVYEGTDFETTLSYTAGSFTVPITYTYNSSTIHLSKTIPFSVNINRYLSYFQVDEKEFKTEFTNYKTTTDDTLVAYYSSITENAKNISLKVGTTTFNSYLSKLADTGIDIENQKITLTADNLVCKNNSEEKTMWLDRNGNLGISGVLNKMRITITPDNFSNYFYNGYVTDLDYYCDSDISNFKTLFDDAAVGGFAFVQPDVFALDGEVLLTNTCTTTSGKYFILPFYIPNDEIYTTAGLYGVDWIRTLTNANTGTSHLITEEELGQLVGRRITFTNVSTPYIRIMHPIVSDSFYQFTQTDEELQTYQVTINGQVLNNYNYIKLEEGESATLEFKSTTFIIDSNLAATSRKGYHGYYWDLVSFDQHNVDFEFTNNKDDE